ncbi:MAG: iron ABC transporter permease [Bacteroidota bacterium]
MRIRSKHLKRDLNQWSIYTLAIGLFVAIPVFAIFIYLFDGVGEMWDHITTYFLPDYILNSLILLLGTGSLTFLIGTSTAWIVSNYDFPLRGLVEWLLFLPMAIPSYIVAYVYVGLLGYEGTLIRGLQSLGISITKIDVMNIGGLIWILSISLYPYVYAATKGIFQSFPRSMRENSALLQASSRHHFFKLALPLASPAIIAGLFLVFMEVLNDYGAAKYYGIQTFTTGIFRTWTALEDLQSAVYLSALLVVLMFLLNSLMNWLRNRRSYALKISQEDTQKQARRNLKGSQKALYLIVLWIPIIMGVLLPVFQLIYWATLTYESMLNWELLWISLQSFGLALSAAVLIVVVSLALINFANWNHLKGIKALKKISTIGYVIPGAIIGIGVIKSSQSIINFFDTYFDLAVGNLFYGSSFILVYAYVFRFLAVAYNPIEANSLKLGKNLSESAYTLKISKLATLLRVNLPLLRPTLISALILVFIDILKELPLTLILKPYKLQTLAVKAYEYADDERVAEAAWPSLLLIFVIVLLMLLVEYGPRKNRLQASK